MTHMLVSDNDHSQGLLSAEMTLIEYGDYHDPQCAGAQEWIKELQAEMGERLRFVFRHFPSSSTHPHAAEAAEAAGLQDRFWEMHEKLLAHPDALGNGFLVEYARELGLDTSQFLRDMASRIPAERVQYDRDIGAKSGVSVTPTFFVNGVLQTTNLASEIFPDGCKSIK